MRLLTLLLGVALIPTLRADPIHHIGNTLLIKRATGTGRVMYHADHSFVLITTTGETVRGTWLASDGKLCHTPIESKMEPFCVKDDPIHTVGDTWKVTSPDGIPEELTLIAGQK